jgi:hypothetical protein
MDSLFDDDIAVPFSNTAIFDGHCFLNEGLERRDTPQRVLDPVPATFPSSDESSSDDDDDSPRAVNDFAPFNTVTSTFAPGGEDSRFGYQLKDREPATNPPVKRMVLLAPNGTQILVFPRCFPKKKITRACVELAVCQWMEDQQNLPPGVNQVQIQTGNVDFEVQGETWRAPVWLWRGIEQVVERPEAYRLYL